MVVVVVVVVVGDVVLVLVNVEERRLGGEKRCAAKSKLESRHVGWPMHFS